MFPKNLASVNLADCLGTPKSGSVEFWGKAIGGIAALTVAIIAVMGYIGQNKKDMLDSASQSLQIIAQQRK